MDPKKWNTWGQESASVFEHKECGLLLYERGGKWVLDSSFRQEGTPLCSSADAQMESAWTKNFEADWVQAATQIGSSSFSLQILYGKKDPNLICGTYTLESNVHNGQPLFSRETDLGPRHLLFHDSIKNWVITTSIENIDAGIIAKTDQQNLDGSEVWWCVISPLSDPEPTTLDAFLFHQRTGVIFGGKEVASGPTSISLRGAELNVEEEKERFIELFEELLVKPRVTTLTHVDFSGNAIDAETLRAMARSLAACPALTSLNIAMNRVGPEGVTDINFLIENVSSLSSLDIRYNRIGAGGMSTLSEGLANGRLSVVRLAGNEIGTEGMRELCGKLPLCSALLSLDLRDNAIGVEGVKRLGGILGACPSLATLNLRYNYLGPEGATVLSSALSECPSLTSLNLKGNNIGDDGALAIFSTLETCPNITHVNLAWNLIGSDVQSRITTLSPLRNILL